MACLQACQLPLSLLLCPPPDTWSGWRTDRAATATQPGSPDSYYDGPIDTALRDIIELFARDINCLRLQRPGLPGASTSSTSSKSEKLLHVECSLGALGPWHKYPESLGGIATEDKVTIGKGHAYVIVFAERNR